MLQMVRHIYPCEKTLRKHKSCVEECGIAKVKVVLVEIVQEENYDRDL